MALGLLATGAQTTPGFLVQPPVLDFHSLWDPLAAWSLASRSRGSARVLGSQTRLGNPRRFIAPRGEPLARLLSTLVLTRETSWFSQFSKSILGWSKSGTCVKDLPLGPPKGELLDVGLFWDSQKVEPCLKGRSLRPELLNRLDDIVVFHPLSREVLQQAAVACFPPGGHPLAELCGNNR